MVHNPPVTSQWQLNWLIDLENRTRGMVARADGKHVRPLLYLRQPVTIGANKSSRYGNDDDGAVGGGDSELRNNVCLRDAFWLLLRGTRRDYPTKKLAQ